MRVGNKQEHKRSDVSVACNGRMVGVQYRVASHLKPGPVNLVFSLVNSNGGATSTSLKTTFSFRSDGDSPALDAQVAAAIARFVKKKVDTSQLVLPAETESPSVGPDPMNLEVEPQASSGKCFRLRLEQKIEGGFT